MYPTTSRYFHYAYLRCEAHLITSHASVYFCRKNLSGKKDAKIQDLKETGQRVVINEKNHKEIRVFYAMGCAQQYCKK